MTLKGSPKTSMPGNQFAVADAAMYIESARALLFQEARSVTAKAQSEIPFIPDDSIMLSMAGLVATQNAQLAVDRLFAIRGAHGLYEKDEFERYYRDVRMGTLVANQTPDLVREWLGKHLFGIPADVQPRWGKCAFGVAGGLAEYFGVSPMLVRMAFVVGAAFSTLDLVAYVILVVWMPKPPAEGK